MPNKMERAGESLTKAGKVMNGLVLSIFALIVIIFIADALLH